MVLSGLDTALHYLSTLVRRRAEATQRHARRRRLPRQAGRRHHPVGGVRHHRKTLLAELAGEIARQIGAGQIQQRARLLQLLGLDAGQHEVAQGARIAPGRHHLRESGLAGRRRGMFSDRKQRQFDQPAAGKL